MIGILYPLSQAIAGLALAMIPPIAIAFAADEPHAFNAFVVVAALVGFIAAATLIALRGRPREPGRMGSYVLVVVVWTIIPVIAAVPLMRTSGTDYLTALFESVSGFTTTGATAVASVEALGLAGVFFRAELEWFGGLMTLVTIAGILAATGLGGLSRSQVALVSGGEDRLGHLLSSVRRILIAYVTITIACIVLLIISGIPPFQAVCLGFTTVSTGGFMPIDGTFADYDNAAANVVVSVFMLIGATSIVWHRMVVEGRFRFARRHRESYWVIGVAILLSLAYMATFGERSFSPDGAPAHWISGGLLTGISLVSTTGFEAHPGAITALPATLVLFVALVGASGLSTAGGIKFYRIGALMTLSGTELRRLIYPHSVRESRFGSVPYSLDMMKAILGSLFVALLTLIAATALLATALPNFESAITAAIAAFSNIGPLYSAGWIDPVAWPAYPDFDPLAKLVMIVTMILGRLEVLVVFATLNLAYWRS